MDARISIPKLFYEGSYTCVGSLLLVPIDWSGRFNMSMGGVTDTWSLRADIVQKGKQTYLDLQSFSFSPDVTTFSTYATGLFGGFGDVGDIVLKYMNKHWKPFFDLVRMLGEPEVAKEASEAARSILFETPVGALNSV